MQKEKRNARNPKSRKVVRLEEFLEEDDNRFDEEDEDTVTDDTLEFLSLDDEAIRTYQQKEARKKPAGKRRLEKAYKEQRAYAQDDYEDGDYEEDAYEDDYEDDDYEEDACEDDYEDDDYEENAYEDDYEDGDYEDGDYEEDAYEDDYEDYADYEEDEYEYEDYDERESFGSRVSYFITHLSTLDMVVAMLGILVLIGGCVTGGIFVHAKNLEKQVSAFAEVGSELAGVQVVGESGLDAVDQAARAIQPEETQEPESDQQSDDAEKDKDKKTVTVTLNITSIQSDMKVKFVNKETGKLIGSVPFEVSVTGGKKNFDLKDDDKDGIIYQTGVAAGSYQVSVKALDGEQYKSYILPGSASSVTVSDKIAYKKVDVADEVKSESEVNAAAEDTAIQDTAQESALADTVEWVESTKTPIGEGEETYVVVDKKSITDPWTVSSAFRKMVAEEQTQSVEDAVVELSSSSLELTKGKSGTLSVSVTNTDVRYAVEWSSSDTGVATVSDGTVTAVGVGSATITAKVSVGSLIQECTCQVTVTEESKPAEITVELNNTSMELTKGQTGNLNVSVSGADSDYKTEWSSSDTGVATVSDGTVTAVGAGNATITVKISSGGVEKSASCKVKVTEEKSTETVYTKVTISGATEVAVGKTITLSAQTEPAGGSVKWSSDNEKIAKVDGSGVVTGVAEGTAQIKAVCEKDEKISATWQVKVKKTVTVDGSTKLKDKDGNQLYYKEGDTYKEATYDDYKKRDTFYKKSKEVKNYKYTGWQTIDGHVYYYDKNGNYVTGEQVIQGAKYTFGSDGKLAASSGSMGIDVSKWNGSIDWNAVKNSGVSYVIIRCGYRGSSTGALIEDPKFRSNIQGAKAAGLKVGVYFFSQAVNEVEAVEEASMALSLIKGYSLNYPVFLDVEASGGRGDGVSKDVRTAVCKAFCATIQNSGYSAGIYANKTWFTERINTGSLTGYKIWLAQYASAPTYTTTRYDIWQYSSTGKVSGINGKVDMNISYLNY